MLSLQCSDFRCNGAIPRDLAGDGCFMLSQITISNCSFQAPSILLNNSCQIKRGFPKKCESSFVLGYHVVAHKVANVQCTVPQTQGSEFEPCLELLLCIPGRNTIVPQCLSLSWREKRYKKHLGQLDESIEEVMGSTFCGLPQHPICVGWEVTVLFN